MSKVYHLEINGQHSYYTTLTGLCVNNIGVSKYTLDRYDFKEPYRNDICIIRKGVLNSGVKTKLPEVKKFPLPDMLPEPKELPLPEPTKQTNLKINIQEGTYIKKPDGYYFKLNGLTLHENEFFTKYGEKYSYPEKIIGDIETLLY